MLKKSLSSSGLRFLWISLFIFAIDWVSKALANTYLALYIPKPIFPFFNLTLAYNTGAAFSLLDNGHSWPNRLFMSIAIMVSFVMLFWLCRLPRSERRLGVGLALILGGAFGNLWDRFCYQHVIDFIDLYVSHWHWPVFNVADLAVSVGALLIVWQWLTVKR